MLECGWELVLCKQKTAYEMRMSDWSSDVCASDLTRVHGRSSIRCRFDGGRRLRDDVARSDRLSVRRHRCNRSDRCRSQKEQLLVLHDHPPILAPLSALFV